MLATSSQTTVIYNATSTLDGILPGTVYVKRVVLLTDSGVQACLHNIVIY